MTRSVLIVGLLMTLAGPVAGVWAAAGSTSGNSSHWARFSSTAPAAKEDDGASAARTSGTPETLAVPTAEVFAVDNNSAADASVSDSIRLFRVGASPHYYGAHHEPPPNYNFRDPHYYPNSGLGFPIRSAHGSWIGGRSGGRGWKHTGYHEKYRQGTFQWRW